MPQRGSSALVPALWTGIYAALLLARIPEALVYRRLWAEDATIFLRYAWDHGWAEILLAAQLGYCVLLPNLTGGVAAHAVPLEWAPLPLIVIALLFQLLPAVLVAATAPEWARSGWRMPLAMALVLFAPISEEAHGNMASTQFHGLVCAGIVLASRPRTGAAGGLQLGVLALAGLTGVGAVLLAPLFSPTRLTATR